jgi:hypothetical protein
MGARNYLIEGVSGAGKTTVAEELQRRGFHVLHGDRELAYRGDPETGEPLDEPRHASPAAGLVWRHRHWVWDEGKVRSALADHRHPVSFLCGGSRNFARFLDLFDGVFVLDVDLGTLERRLASRPEDEFGGRPEEQALITRLHATKEDIPASGVVIDSARPVRVVVDDILSRCAEAGRGVA